MKVHHQAKCHVLLRTTTQIKANPNLLSLQNNIPSVSVYGARLEFRDSNLLNFDHDFGHRSFMFFEIKFIYLKAK